MLIVHPVGTTEDGIGVHMPPVHRFGIGADPAEVGHALRDSLTLSTTLAPPRLWQERRELVKMFLRAAGVRSWRQLETNAVACWIREDNGRMTLTPLRNGGTRGDKKGFQPFDATDVSVSSSEPDARLGEALFAALEHSE